MQINDILHIIDDLVNGYKEFLVASEACLE